MMTKEQKKLVEELEEFLLKLGNEPIIIGMGIGDRILSEFQDEFRFDIDDMSGAWTWWIPNHNLQIRCTLGWEDEWLKLPFEIDKGELLHMDHMIVGDIKTLPRLVNFYFNSLNKMYSDWLKKSEGRGG
tara:strand:+ start:302 stop:688 length:387 start_codon:yes stop_codon:yes gene_type:complete